MDPRNQLLTCAVQAARISLLIAFVAGLPSSAWSAGVSDDGLGPVLKVEPQCGYPGVTSATIKGSGWQPIPVALCYSEKYRYWFNPTGQFGVFLGEENVLEIDQQPLRVFTIPQAEAGMHRVHVELWADPIDAQGWTLLQCREACIQVAIQGGDRWNVLSASTPRPTISIRFEPGSVCGLPDCKRIDLLQVVRFRLSAGGIRRDWTSAELRALKRVGPWLDSLRIGGYVVDQNPGASDPFTTGKDPADQRTGSYGPGRKDCDSVVVAGLYDVPRISLPAVADTVILEFEVNAFCSDGPGQGEWLGRYSWHWIRPRQGASAVHAFGGDGGQPLSESLSALAKFNTQQKYTMPLSPEQPQSGGLPCPD